MVLRIFGNSENGNYTVKSFTIGEEGKTVLVSFKGEGLSEFLPYSDEVGLNALVVLSMPEKNYFKFFLRYGDILEGKGLTEFFVYDKAKGKFLAESKSGKNCGKKIFFDKDRCGLAKGFEKNYTVNSEMDFASIVRFHEHSFLYRGKKSCLFCDMDGIGFMKNTKNYKIAVIDFNRDFASGETEIILNYCRFAKRENKTVILTGREKVIEKINGLTNFPVICKDSVLNINR